MKHEPHESMRHSRWGRRNNRRLEFTSSSFGAFIHGSLSCLHYKRTIPIKAPNVTGVNESLSTWQLIPRNRGLSSLSFLCSCALFIFSSLFNCNVLTRKHELNKGKEKRATKKDKWRKWCVFLNLIWLFSRFPFVPLKKSQLN